MKINCSSKKDTLFPCILRVPDTIRSLKGSIKRESLSALARKVLRISAEKTRLTLETLRKGKNGAPIPCNGTHWSITHKPTYVGAVVASMRIGIDIETIRPVREGLMARIATDPEWQIVSERNDVNFFRLWTAKESVLKAEGKGLAGLAQCSLVQELSAKEMIMSCTGVIYLVRHHFFDNHIAALTIPHDASHHWNILSPSFHFQSLSPQ